MSINEEVIMTVKLWGIDRLHPCFDYDSESKSLSFFNFLFKMLFISLFFIYETRDTLLFILMFCTFRYSYNKIYTNVYLNRDIIVYLKDEVKFT